MTLSANVNSKALLFIFIICSVLNLIQCKLGIDLSIETNITNWECLKLKHQTMFSIVRIYRSLGEIDKNAILNLQKAYTSGIKELGVYVFPCISTSSYSLNNNITCKSAKQQIIDVFEYLTINQINFASSSNVNEISLNRLWLDLEDENPSKYYDSNVTVNQEFIKEMTDTGIELQIPMGIYTTSTYWKQIMNNIIDYSIKNDNNEYVYPIWYPRYDSTNSMDFFQPFGGWNDVLIKQTNGDVNYCSLQQVNSDYMEDN